MTDISDAVDFTGYAIALSAFDRSDALRSEGSMGRATWVYEYAQTVARALPPLGTMGAPRKGTPHKAMADAIRAMFPSLTPDAQKHHITRLFLLCRIAAAPRNARKDGESIEDYAARVDRWAAVANNEDGDKVRALIDGKPRKASPPDGGDGGDDEGDTSTDGTLAGEGGKPKTDPANLVPVILASRRTVRQAFESGRIDQATWDAYLTDMAYETALDKSARAPIQASA